ncbi:MAG TPA: alpha/beta fold hydrolase [Balneolaceae bacterium]|nr:alpha/beta fold hydrolase [Balneolaceae bacterium]
MQSKNLTFEGALGDELSAKLDQPDESTPKAYVLFAHCFTGSKNMRAVRNIARGLTRKNFAVFRFDFTGLGESEGKFEETNFSSNVGDLIKASEYLRSEFQAPDILVGHSLGGAAVLQAAHRIKNSKAVATIAAPADPEHVEQNFVSKIDEIEQKGHAEVTLEGRTFNIKKQFLDDLERQHMDKRIRELDKALILFHSPTDNKVGVENAAHIFETARHPKSFVSLDEADHLITGEKYSLYIGKMLATWSSMYI